MKRMLLPLIMLSIVHGRGQAQVPKSGSSLPAPLAFQILKDHYKGRRPARVQTPIDQWPFVAIDLNDDGRPDYVVEQVDPAFCGSGGCGILIYASYPGGYKCVYSGGEFYSPCQPLRFKTNGFHDLAFRYTDRNGSSYYAVLWFDGHEYKKSEN